MSVTQIGTLITFTSGTAALASEVNSNFSDIRSAFNALVPATDTVAADTVQESTTNNGVVVDGVTLKDGGATLTAALTGTSATFSGAVTANSLSATSGVTLQGSAPTPDEHDYRASIAASDPAVPQAQFYAHSTVVSLGGTGHEVTSLAAYAYAVVPDGSNNLANVKGLEVDTELDDPTTSGIAVGITNAYGAHIKAVAGGNYLSRGAGSAYGALIEGLNGTTNSNNYGAYIASRGGSSIGTSYTLYLADVGVTDTVIGSDSGATLTTAGVWTDASSAAGKRRVNPANRSAAIAALKALTPKRFDRVRKDNPSQVLRPDDIGFLAEEVPELIAEPGRDGIAPGRLATLAIIGWQDHEDRIAALEGAP